ncbi:hypothetical protein GCM10009765_50170 [Fodinicola feengrottensis]|uniref:SRPBCC family protein n=1 Tax=Fodinicola feengrottensis TaxID=435914 RepID=A0ABN2HWV3_9ACTN
MSPVATARKPLFEASAYIQAPIADLIPRLLHLKVGPVTRTSAPLLSRDDERPGWIVSGGPDQFDVHAGGTHVLYMDLDRERHTIGMQGHWWYRGEFTLVSEPPGTRLIHRVYNVAARGRWAVPFANRMFAGYQRRTQQGVDDLARTLSS